MTELPATSLARWWCPFSAPWLHRCPCRIRGGWLLPHPAATRQTESQETTNNNLLASCGSVAARNPRQPTWQQIQRAARHHQRERNGYYTPWQAAPVPPLTASLQSCESINIRPRRDNTTNSCRTTTELTSSLSQNIAALLSLSSHESVIEVLVRAVSFHLAFYFHNVAKWCRCSLGSISHSTA